MRISGVDFPPELLKALRDGDLVVFAGAGVSMGSPASLPNFGDLAHEIASGTGEVRSKLEPEDRFLGWLNFKGVKVHEIAARVLSGQRGQSPIPNALHFDILKLYSKVDRLRIVTTNFDLLFEEAAKDVYEALPTPFSAPVLPLGEKFSGIVHVHGDVNRPDNMVLTDEDFGRAYLTEGWARRFLAALFSSFPVLFIGYSHNDVVMNYLARALPNRDTERFTLVASDEDGAARRKWQLLGIQRIEYRKSADGAHQGLNEGMAGLAEFAQRDSVEWKRLITEIAEQPPPGDEEQMDLIRFALRDAELTSYFTSADTPSEWIGLLHERDDIDGLFSKDIEKKLNRRDELLSQWLARKFAREHADQLFSLISQHRLSLNWHLWFSLSQSVSEETDEPLEPYILSRWVSLLLSTAPPLSEKQQFQWLEWLDLGKRCVEAGLTDSCIDIFEFMAGSRFEIERLSDQLTDENFERGIRGDFKPVCDLHTINDLWKNTLKPNLDDVAEPLLARIVAILERRHRELHAWQAATRSYDPKLIHRNEISPEEDEYYRESVDVVIDAGRDCLIHLTGQRPELAAYWCERLINADSPFLRKLAVHTLHVRTDLRETEKIDWLLNRHNIHDSSTDVETRQLLLSAYPAATSLQRTSVIKAVLAYRWPIEDDENRERRAAYVHYLWLYQLHGIDPACTLTKGYLDGILRDFPGLHPRETEDTTVRSSEGWAGFQSPWSVEEFLARPAGEWVNELLSFQETGFQGPDREGLVEAVKTAATQNIGWGFQLADALVDIGNWQSDLWPSLMRAWCGELSLEEIGLVLDFLKLPALQAPHEQSVVEVLSAVVRNQDLIRSPQLLSEANQIAKQLEEQLGQIDPDLFLKGWLMRAINSMAGRLAEYWLYSLAAWQSQQTPAPKQISPVYRSVFCEIIGDKTLAGTLGKAVLARNSAYLLHADKEWTKTNLLPLFADADDIQVYQAVWDGLLFGRRAPCLAKLLKHSFFKMILRLDDLLPGTNLKKNFVVYFTFMLECIVSDSTEILDGWIPSFFASADEEARIRFAHEIRSRLQCMEDEKQQEWWHLWLERYLENRSLGVPAPLSQGEVGAILGLLPHFKSLFPDAVEWAVKLPPRQMDHNFVLHEIKNGTLWETHPEAVARLLAYLDRCILPSWVWHNEGKELISILLDSTLADAVRRNLLELSARRGLSLQKDEL